ncbi:MAG TPA: 3'-5' exonuclease, partial [Rariglobus sp.]
MKFREPILEVLRQPDYRPATILDLSRAIGLNKKQRPQLAHEIRTLLSKGELVLVNGDRIALPVRASSSSREKGFHPRPSRGSHSADADALVGKINFRAGGSAFVVPPKSGPGPDPDAIQIFPEDTGVALHGDTVEIHVNPGIRQRRDGRGTERTGRVLRVV